VNLLLDKGANINEVQHQLMYCEISVLVQQGQLHVIIIVYHDSAALILQGTSPPVYVASDGGHLAIVELLVSRGAKINQPCDVRLLCAC
jgi:ankyrin repeat protein